MLGERIAVFLDVNTAFSRSLPTLSRAGSRQGSFFTSFFTRNSTGSVAVEKGEEAEDAEKAEDAEEAV